MSFIAALKSPDPAALAFAISILLVSDLWVRVHTPPNPTPTSSKEKDRIGGLTGPIFLFTRRASVRLVGIYHAILGLTYPPAPSTICPKPENLSSYLFTWNRYTAVCILLILVAAPIRLLCFAQLGPNFTFRLDTPKKLVTTGLYAWVQHPSYTANVTVILATAALLLRKDGVAACWLPKSIVTGERFGTALRIAPWILGFFVVYALSVRVRDEEAMLKKTFGEEWEMYHKKTKRFVPYVF